MSFRVNPTVARLLCLALASAAAACAPLQPMETPKSETEMDIRPGLISGRSGELLLYGCAPVDAEKSLDVLGAQTSAAASPPASCNH